MESPTIMEFSSGLSNVSKRPSKQTSTQNVKRPRMEIASLTIMNSCPRMTGTLTFVSIWQNVGRTKARYANFLLKDASGEINGVIYRRNKLDFEANFVVGATMIVENAKVRLKDHDCDNSSPYELVVNEANETIKIVPGAKDNHQLPKSKMKNRILLSDVVDKIPNTKVVDVVGILEEIRELNTIKKDIVNRDLRIIDESSVPIMVTIWHELARNFNAPVGSTVAIYQAAVRTYNGKKGLTFNHKSDLEVDPQIDETNRLKIWYRDYKSDDDCNELNSGEQETSSSNHVQNQFVSISNIHQKISVGQKIDTIGVVVEGIKTEQVPTKDATLKTVAKILITDESRAEIEVTIWLKESDKLNIPVHSIVVAHEAKVTQFENIKKINCYTHQIKIDPNILDVKRRKERILKTLLDTDTDDKIPHESINMMEEKNQTTMQDDIVEHVPDSGRPLQNEHKCLKETRNVTLRGVEPSNMNFTKINDIKEQTAVGTFIDVLGVVRCRMDVLSGSEGKSEKVMIELMDQSNDSIWMGISGRMAKTFDGPKNAIVAAKKVALCSWNGRKELRFKSNISSLIVEPDIHEANELRNWFALHGSSKES